MSAGNDLVDSTKTHPGDTSPKSHVSIETFARDLHDALEIRDVKSHIYDRVSVLVLCWEDAKSEKGLGLRTSINKATEAMSAMGWKIHEHEIPLARNARNVLEGIFYGWMQECASMAAKDDSINILQILYYNGHSYHDALKPKDPFWIGGSYRIDPRNFLQHLRENLRDSLVLLDTCYGARITKGEEGDNTIKEILSATGSVEDVDIAPSGKHSFSCILASCLTDHARRGSSLSVYELYSSIKEEKKYTANPYHGYFGRARERNGSIQLPFLGDTPSRTGEYPKRPLSESTSRILLKVDVEGSCPPSVAEWMIWLSTNVPSSVGQVKVMTGGNSGSQVLFLEMEVAVWDRLRDDPAYTYIAEYTPFP